MSLPAEAIQELQDLYYKKFGEKVDSQTALDVGTKLINLMHAIYRPIPPGQYKNVNKNKHGNTRQKDNG